MASHVPAASHYRPSRSNLVGRNSFRSSGLKSPLPRNTELFSLIVRLCKPRVDLPSPHRRYRRACFLCVVVWRRSGSGWTTPPTRHGPRRRPPGVPTRHEALAAIRQCGTRRNPRQPLTPNPPSESIEMRGSRRWCNDDGGNARRKVKNVVTENSSSSSRHPFLLSHFAPAWALLARPVPPVPGELSPRRNSRLPRYTRSHDSPISPPRPLHTVDDLPPTGNRTDASSFVPCAAGRLRCQSRCPPQPALLSKIPPFQNLPTAFQFVAYFRAADQAPHRKRPARPWSSAPLRPQARPGWAIYRPVIATRLRALPRY